MNSSSTPRRPRPKRADVFGKAKARPAEELNESPEVEEDDTPHTLPEPVPVTLDLEEVIADLRRPDETKYISRRVYASSLTPKQRLGFTALKDALIAKQAYLHPNNFYPDGREVQNNADALRWLFEYFADHLPAEDETTGKK